MDFGLDPATVEASTTLEWWTRWELYKTATAARQVHEQKRANKEAKLSPSQMRLVEWTQDQDE